MTKSENRIQELEKQLEQKNAYITQLENLNDAYDKLEELTHQELLDADQTFRAQEMVSEAMRKEQLFARRTIEAHERLAELSSLEKQEDRKFIQVQENLTSLSVQELQERDFALSSILTISRDLSLILDEKKMLRKILSSLMQTLKAERGVLFLFEKDELIPRVRKNISLKAVRSPGFEKIRNLVDTAYKKKKSQFQLFHGELKEPVWSVLIVPLIYEKSCLGVIYVDLLSADQNFRKIDLEIAQIFSLHAAILLNNVSLYEKIKKQNLELLKLLNLKNQMLEQLSEEVNTPVQKIDQNLRNFLNQIDLSTDQVKLSENILNQIEKVEMTLLRVINLQELEKEVDDLFRDDIDFRDLFELILKTHSHTIVEKNIHITLNLSQHCTTYHGNKIILRTLFDELVSNAVFYNKPTGEIWIRGFKRGDHLCFKIKDTGTGIFEEELKHIFEQFYRADSSETLNERGAGLGLYMVKSFVQHYRGDVQVESTPGKGSTFTVCLLVN